MWWATDAVNRRHMVADETGGILITPLPGATDLKPGSATRPFFGITPQLIDVMGLN